MIFFPIKIILADDHQLVIDGIKSILATDSDIDVIGQALNGNQLLNLLTERKPDIILMDINMPRIDGVKATKAISETYPDIIVCILSTYDDVRLIKEILKLGAKGYVLKTSPHEELIKAIKVLAAGGNYYSEAISNKIMKSLSQQSSPENPFQAMLPISLTKREKEIIKLIAMEYSGREIAGELHISQNTVETHRKNLLRKLKAKNTAGLVKYAMKHDLI